MTNEEQLNEIIEKWQNKTYNLRKCAYRVSGILGGVFVIAVVAVVITQFVSNNNDWKVSAEICNTFTGIILGFVAMAVSVISIILSFYNTIQAENSNIDSIKQFYQITAANEELSSKLKEVSESLSDDMDKLTLLIQQQSNFEELLLIISEEVKNLTPNNNETTPTSVSPAPTNIEDEN